MVTRYRLRRCPYCGRAAQNIRQAPPSGATSGCDENDSTYRQLYSNEATVRRRSICCDIHGCREYEGERNRFWPGFCRPRWLRCYELYER